MEIFTQDRCFIEATFERIVPFHEAIEIRTVFGKKIRLNSFFDYVQYDFHAAEHLRDHIFTFASSFRSY